LAAGAAACTSGTNITNDERIDKAVVIIGMAVLCVLVIVEWIRRRL